MVDGAAAGPPFDSHVDLSSCRPVGVIYSQCIRIIIFGELLWPYGHHHTPIRIAIHKSRVTMGLPSNGRIRSRCGVRSTNLMSRSIFSVRNSAGHRPRTHLLLSPVSDLWEYHEGHGDCMHCQVNHLISPWQLHYTIRTHNNVPQRNGVRSSTPGIPIKSRIEKCFGGLVPDLLTINRIYRNAISVLD